MPRLPFALAILAAVVLAAACTTAALVARPHRPNLVLFLVDDLGWQDTSIDFGVGHQAANAHFRTPNLERLVREGVRCPQAYAQCVCTPSRVSILTGANSARHGVTNWTLLRDHATDGEHAVLQPPAWHVNGLSADPATPRAFCAPTLPAQLHAQGYRTILVGKAHFGAVGTPGADPRQLGFDVNVAGHAAGAPGSYLAQKDFRRDQDDGVWQVPGLESYHGSDAFLSDVLTTEALREIDRAQQDGQPFYLHFAHYAVHLPLEPDARFVGRYQAMGLGPQEAMYAAMVEGVDHSLGRLLDHLAARGLLDDTVVVFTSDNGGLSATGRGGAPHGHNAPLRSGKGSAYEGGLRVPFVVRWPGTATPGGVVTAPIICEDLYASFCTAAGADAACADGRDLAPVLRGERAPARALFFHYPNVWGPPGPGIEPFSAVRRGDHKLIWFWADGRAELYDVVADPGERQQLSAVQPATATALRAELHQYLRAVGALVPTRKDGAPVAWP